MHAGPPLPPSPSFSKAVEIARRIADADEHRAILCVRLQKEFKMRPHEAVAVAKRVLAGPEAASMDPAVSAASVARRHRLQDSFVHGPVR